MSKNSHSNMNSSGFIEMTEFEYFCGLVLLILGFNIGYHEAGKGLSFEDLRNISQKVFKRVRRKRSGRSEQK